MHRKIGSHFYFIQLLFFFLYSIVSFNGYVNKGGVKLRVFFIIIEH